MHKDHAETFYILQGSVDFYLDGEWLSAPTGACIDVAPGTLHAAKITEGLDAARMLMVFQPAGFDGFLAELSKMTEADFADEAKMSPLNEKYDIVPLGPVPGAD